MNLMAAISRRPWRSTLAAVVLMLLAGLVWAEARGWPFLADPLQRSLSRSLARQVALAAPDDADRFHIRFLGGVKLRAAQLEVAAPDWSTAPYTLLARDLRLDIGYLDLWRAWRGQRLHLQRFQASTLEVDLQRLSDGRASWDLARGAANVDAATPSALPSVGQLQLGTGSLRYRDQALGTELQARLRLAEVAEGPQLRLDASGQYQGRPVEIDLRSVGAMAALAGGTAAAPLPFQLKATVGRARLAFDGVAADARSFAGFSGRFDLSGPSLAAVGDPLGVTLPTTPAFRAKGVLVRQGDVWQVHIDDATVGASRLNGAFRYDAGRDVPLLSGRLGGARLALADLGPAVGTTALDPAEPAAASTAKHGRVLPDRPFDLPSLRAMEANVLVDIADLDLNTRLLEPLRPLRGHLQLRGGVLSLSDLVARTGEGRISGAFGLDGRGETALWNAQLRWDGIRMERWIRQVRDDPQAPPYMSGRWTGQVVLQGQGSSTAQILGSLDGQARTALRRGSVSHLLVEAAGVDVAESLGRLIQGDAPLAVSCAAADLSLQDGVVRPRVFVLDTADSTAWLDGSVSLASEAIDLRVVVTPKDFSPLTLRAPLRVGGSFAEPQVSVELAPMGLKLAAAFLLGLVNPLAALIPFIDPGSAEDAQQGADDCRALTERARPALVDRPARTPRPAPPKVAS